MRKVLAIAVLAWLLLAGLAGSVAASSSDGALRIDHIVLDWTGGGCGGG